MLCVICSAGGHLAEALLAVSASDVDRFYVTKDDGHVEDLLKGYKVYFVTDPHTSLIKYMQNGVQSLRIFLKERPEVILTTGAGIALPMCIIAKIFGSKIVFVESGARVTTMSKTGKLLYKIADVTYVQWKALQNKYPRSLCVGRLE